MLLVLALAGCQKRSGRAKSEAERARRAAKIQALPYLATAPIKEKEKRKVGVTRRRPGLAAPGVTVYCSEETDRVLWVDLEGKVRHELHVPGERCKLLEPTGEGDFLLLGDGFLSRVSWQAKVRWRLGEKYNPTRPGRLVSFHHDMAMGPGGGILALTNNNRLVPHKGRKIPIRDDEITVLTGQGKRLRAHSLYDLLGQRWVKPDRLDQILKEVEAEGLEGVGWGDKTDILHVNTVEVLGKETRFGQPGQVLICSRYLDLVALVDLQQGEVVWSWGPGQVQWPHHPTVLPSGRLLMFDNGSKRKWSRALELDPRKGALFWQYGAAGGKDRFFTDTRGSAQALPGGTVLITESDRGRIFEVTRRGELVWEYYNPELLEKEGKTERRLIYRAARYAPDAFGIPALEAKLRAAGTGGTEQ